MSGLVTDCFTRMRACYETKRHDITIHISEEQADQPVLCVLPPSSPLSPYPFTLLGRMECTMHSPPIKAATL